MKPGLVRCAETSTVLAALLVLFACSQDAPMESDSDPQHGSPSRNAADDLSVQVVDLGSMIGGPENMANDVNNDGWIVGWRKDPSTRLSRAVLWKHLDAANQLTDLGTLHRSSHAEAVSEEGHVVGANVTIEGDQLGFLWTAEAGMVDLGDHGNGGYSPTFGVNNSGVVAADVRDGNLQQFAARGSEGAGWQVATEEKLHRGEGRDITNDGLVVGKHDVNDPQDAEHGMCYPTAWSGGSVQKLGSTAWVDCELRAVNESEQAVGWIQDLNGKYPVIATSTGVQTLNTLGGNGEAYDINEQGWIVGSVNDDGRTAAALWLSSSSDPILLTDLQPGSESISIAKGLNDQGLIVGESKEDRFDDPRAVLWIVTGDPGDGTPSTIEELEDAVTGLVDDGTLNRGQGRALTAKLAAAKKKRDRGQNRPAANILGAFINQVEAFQRAGILSEEEAGPLIEGAEAIIDELVG